MLFHCVKGIYSAFTQTSYLSYTALAQLLSATLNSGWVGQSCMLQMTILGISALIVKTSECWSPLKPGHMILNYASVNKNMEQWQKISKDTTDPLSVVKCRASWAYTCHQEKCPLCISISSKFNIIKHFFFFSSHWDLLLVIISTASTINEPFCFI